MPAGAILDGPEQALKWASADLDVPEMTSKAHELMDTKSRTLLMTFGEQGKAYEIQHRPPPEPKAGGWASAIVGRVAGNPGYDAASARDREQVYNAGPNGLVVFHGDMGTLRLSASDAQKNAAVLGARMRTVEAIAQRQNQATNEVVTDPTSGPSSLSPEQRAAFLHAGPPTRRRLQTAKAWSTAGCIRPPCDSTRRPRDWARRPDRQPWQRHDTGDRAHECRDVRKRTNSLSRLPRPGWHGRGAIFSDEMSASFY